MEEVPLSTFPYLGGFDAPEDVPHDYYARVGTDAALPVRVVESGWASRSFGGLLSSNAEQARYIRRQAALLDSARATAVFQINFSDFDVSTLPPPQPPSLLLFTSIGLVDSALQAKPALSAWDSTFIRPRR